MKNWENVTKDELMKFVKSYPCKLDGDIIDIEKAEKYIPISDADCANEYDEYYVNTVSYTLEYTLDIMRTTDFEKYEILFTANW